MILFRPSLLLENYQPWLDLKISSKVDASLSEVTDLINIAVYTQAKNVKYLWERESWSILISAT